MPGALNLEQRLTKSYHKSLSESLEELDMKRRPTLFVKYFYDLCIKSVLEIQFYYYLFPSQNIQCNHEKYISIFLCT